MTATTAEQSEEKFSELNRGPQTAWRRPSHPIPIARHEKRDTDTSHAECKSRRTPGKGERPTQHIHKYKTQLSNSNSVSSVSGFVTLESGRSSPHFLFLRIRRHHKVRDEVEVTHSTWGTPLPAWLLQKRRQAWNKSFSVEMNKYRCLEAQLNDDDSSNSVEILSETNVVKPTFRNENSLEKMNKNVLLAHLLNTSVPNSRQEKTQNEVSRQTNYRDSQLFQQLVCRDTVRENEPLQMFAANFGHQFRLHVLPPSTINSHSQWTKIPNGNILPQSNVQESQPVRKRYTTKPRKVLPKPAVITTEEVRARVERNQGIRILQRPIRCTKRCATDITLSELLTPSKRLPPVSPPSPSTIPSQSPSTILPLSPATIPPPPSPSPIPLPSLSPIQMPMPITSGTATPSTIPVEVVSCKTTVTTTTTRKFRQLNSRSTQTDETTPVLQPKTMEEQEVMLNEMELKKELYLFKFMVSNLQRTITELKEENKALKLLTAYNKL